MSEAQGQAAVNLEEVIGKYIDLRDAVEREQKALTERLKPMTDAMAGIETYLMALANSTGQTQFGTKRGTAFVTTKTGCNIADRDLFWNYLLENPVERRPLLTLSANKTAVGEVVTAKGSPPPGINWTVMKAIQVRRS